MIKLNSMLEIIDKYENYIIDQWGVMHNGSVGYKHAIEAINYQAKLRGSQLGVNAAEAFKLLRKLI